MVKIADSLQSVQDNVFAEITSADMSAYFAGKLIAGLSALPMLPSPAGILNPHHMFATSANSEEAVPVIEPIMLLHRRTP